MKRHYEEDLQNKVEISIFPYSNLKIINPEFLNTDTTCFTAS